MSFTVRKEFHGSKLKELTNPFKYFKGKRLKDLRVTAYIADYKDALGIGVSKIDNIPIVLSDLRFYDKVLNETNFDETFTPFGYSRWKKMRYRIKNVNISYKEKNQ